MNLVPESDGYTCIIQVSNFYDVSRFIVHLSYRVNSKSQSLVKLWTNEDSIWNCTLCYPLEVYITSCSGRPSWRNEYPSIFFPFPCGDVQEFCLWFCVIWNCITSFSMNNTSPFIFMLYALVEARKENDDNFFSFWITLFLCELRKMIWYGREFSFTPDGKSLVFLSIWKRSCNPFCIAIQLIRS